MIRFLTNLHLRYWPIILIVVLGASALSVKPTINLFKNISTDPVDLLPKKHPNVLTLLNVREKLQRGVRAGMVIESDDREANIRFIQDLVGKLKQLPNVAQVEWQKTGYAFFDKNKLLYMDKKDLESIRDRMDKKIQKEKMAGFYFDLEDTEEEDVSFSDLENKYRSKYSKDVTSQYMESPDGKIFSISVEGLPGDTSLAAASKLRDSLSEFVKTLKPKDFHPSMNVYLTGATKVIEYRTLMSDLTKVGIISSILIFIPLLVRFRSFLNVILMFLPLFIGLPISFSAATIFVPKLNLCTSFLFAILGGLGIENGIHIFSRYYDDRRKGMPIDEAVEEIYTKTGRAILTSVASVAVTFLALAWNDFRGFSEFGIISGIGLIVLFFIYFLFMPSLLVGVERFNILKYKEREEVTHIGEWKFLKLGFNWILICGIILTVFSGIVTPFLSFEYRGKATRAEIPELNEINAKQSKTVTRVNNPAVVMIDGSEDAQKLKEKILAIAQDDTLTPTVDTTRSFYDLLPTGQAEKMKIIQQIKRMLDDKTIRLVKGEKRKDIDRFREAVAQTSMVTENDIPADLKYVFKGNPSVPGELFYINALPMLELDDGQNAMKFADDIATINIPPHTYYPSSDGIVYGLVLKTMLNDAPRVLILSALCIIFFVFLDFRRFSSTMVVVTPIFLGALWMFGMMWVAGIRLNFFNIIIVPAVLGMSIDNSIHIFHRYKELGPGSLPSVLKTSGLAALLASLTNASAFVGLLFCTHKGLFSIGELAVFGVATCLLSTLVFFPALLEFFEKVRIGRKRPFHH